MIKYDSFKKATLEKIYETFNVRFELSNGEWVEVIEQIQRDLLYNKLYYQREITYLDFIERVYIYLSMNSRINNKAEQ